MTAHADDGTRDRVAHTPGGAGRLRRLVVGAVVLSAVALFGCGPDGVPSAIRQRRELPYCGLALVIGVPPASNTVQALDCFKNAYLVGDAAELRLRIPGMEGGVQRAWVRSVGSGRAEVFVEPETVFPEYGGYPTDDPLYDDWVRYDCPDLAFSAEGFPLYRSDACDREALPLD